MRQARIMVNCIERVKTREKNIEIKKPPESIK